MQNKPRHCAICKAVMGADEPFAWHRGTRSVVGGKLGGSYSIGKIARFQPKHTFDCFAVKVEADSRARAMAEIDAACEYAASAGETPEWIAAYRAKLLAAASNLST
jgi:hypothetical protein